MEESQEYTKNPGEVLEGVRHEVRWIDSTVRAQLDRARMLSKEDIIMERIRLGANFTVFMLFFGVATLEAFQTRNWLKAALWLAIGGMFLVADNRRRER